MTSGAHSASVTEMPEDTRSIGGSLDGSRARQKYEIVVELLIVAGLAVVVWLARWVAFGRGEIVGDGSTYLRMAGGGEGDPFHFCHILGPRLAGLFADATDGFFCLATVSFVGTSLAVCILLRHPSFRTGILERVFGVALFMGVYTGVSMFRAYFLNDSLTYLMLAIACTAVLYQRDALLSSTTALAMLNRETALFVVPVWLAFNIKPHGVRGAAFRCLFIFLPAAVVYTVLHHTPLFFGRIPPQGDYLSPQTMRALWNGCISWLGTSNVALGLSICVWLSYGPVWFVAAWGYARSVSSDDEGLRRSLIALGMLLLPVIPSLLVVDWRRGFQPLFPVMIPSGVIGARALTAGLPWSYWCIFACGTALATVWSVEGWWAHPIRIPVVAAAILWICALGVVLAARSCSGPPQRQRNPACMSNFRKATRESADVI